ncbi:unnamed protein product, partial [Choristocarpus tenellus]
MLSAAEADAGSANADEGTLLKKISQLQCRVDLLQGEKDRRDAMETEAAEERRSEGAKRAAREKRLECELEGALARLKQSEGLVSDGLRAKEALVGAEAKLTRVVAEQMEIQESGDRARGRCSQLELESKRLQERLSRMEEDLVVAAGVEEGENMRVHELEKSVEDLQEDLKAAKCRCSVVEGEARDIEVRSKRLQQEVEIMRTEYERVSDENMDLNARIAAMEAVAEEEASSKAEQAQMLAHAADTSAELDVTKAHLEKARTELERVRLEAKVECDGAVEEVRAEMEVVVKKASFDTAAAVAEVKAEAERLVSLGEVKVKELSEEVDRLSAVVAREGRDATEARQNCAEMKERLRLAERQVAEARAMSESTEQQLRRRIEAQVVEVKALEREVMSEREHTLELEESLRSAVERSTREAGRAGEQERAGLLAEMEGLMEGKMLAESKADEMEKELLGLRSAMADAEKRAAEEQDVVIKAATERMAGLEKAVLEKECAMKEVEEALDAERRERAGAASSISAARSEAEWLRAELASQREAAEQKDARICKLEKVKFTATAHQNYLDLKEAKKAALAENEGLRQKLAVAVEAARVSANAAAASKGEKERGTSIVGGESGRGVADRVVELENDRQKLADKLRRYAKHVHGLERQLTRVRTVLVEAGFAPEDLEDLAEAVLELSERAFGNHCSSDASTLSVMSTV